MKAIEKINIHKKYLKDKLFDISQILYLNGVNHDNSKFSNEELPYFEKVEDIKVKEYQDDNYKKSMEILKPALDHHYSINRHHPEHFENGVDEMNLLDLIEMVFDWEASARVHGTEFNPEDNFNRFNISSQLGNIIKNTIRDFKE